MALSDRVQDTHPLLDEYKLYKNLNLDDTTMDNRLNLFLYSLQDLLLEQYGIPLIDDDTVYERQYKTNFNKKILIPYSKFLLEGVRDENNVIIDLATISIEDSFLYSDSFTPNKNYKISFKLGWTIETLPMNIKTAIFSVVDHLLSKIDNGGNALSSFTDPNAGKAVLIKNIPNEFYFLISPYKVLNV